jgi:hypothetical protein
MLQRGAERKLKLDATRCKFWQIRDTGFTVHRVIVKIIKRLEYLSLDLIYNLKE